MIRKGSVLTVLALIASAAALFASITLGQAYQGYTLFSPNNSNRSYLVDMTNTVAHSWTHNRNGGYSCYLLPDGSLMRSAVSSNSNLNGGAAMGIVQRAAPNGSLLWEYTYSSNMVRTHHDIEPMPNGNVLLIAWERKTSAEAVQAGLDHTAEMWPDHIIEVQQTGPTTGMILWEWHVWDHLIQDHDPTKDNYGVVEDHPELIDINLGLDGLGGGDWLHTNAVSYNSEWDQIVISSHNLNEIYVIDHSTTTEEAASHEGGRSGKGGDILYRWGKPSNYGAPGSQVFRVVHCSAWIPAGYPGAGNILAFNNREGQGTSMVVELVLPADAEGNYYLAPGQAYGPTSPVWSYTASDFYSNHLGGCQRLPNGNTLIAESTSGFMFEVNTGGQRLWSYDRSDEIARALRYGNGYSGLVALGLGADAQDGEAAEGSALSLGSCYPNPFRPSTTISYFIPENGPVSLRVFDLAGRELAILVDETQSAGPKSLVFEADGLSSGAYFYRLQAGGEVRTRRFLLLR